MTTPTQCIYSFITNDSQQYRYWIAEAEKRLQWPNPAHALAEKLEGEFAADMPQLTGVAGVLMEVAFVAIDWGSIAEGLIETAAQQRELDEEIGGNETHA
jgi:hypothetical protein